MVQATGLTGINPLSYMGVDPYSPVPLVIYPNAPTVNDNKNFALGTIWIVEGISVSINEIWNLVSLEKGVATWVQLYPGGGSGGTSIFNCDTGSATEVGGVISIVGGTDISTLGSGSTVTISANINVASTYNADSGSAAPVAGVLNILGGSNINTSASGNTVTVGTNANIDVTGNLIVNGTSTFVGGATFASSTTFNGPVAISSLGQGVVQSNSSGFLSSNEGTNGQMLIGSSSGAPAWGNLTSMDSSVMITNGANTINLSASGGSVITGRYFAAYLLNDLTLVGPGPYAYQLGSSGGPGGILTVISNGGGAFTPGDGVSTPAKFTAPATGIYSFTISVGVKQGSTYSTSGWLYLFTNDFNYVGGGLISPAFPADPAIVAGIVQAYGTFAVPMTIGDVATFAPFYSGSCTFLGTTPSSLYPTFPASLYTYVSGYRLA